MALQLPPPPWLSPSWQGAPQSLDNVIAALNEQRQMRELVLQLRVGLQDSQAEFSYLRVKGLKGLAAAVTACTASPEWMRRFRETQLDVNLQIVPCLFFHSLAPAPRSHPPSPSGSPGKPPLPATSALSPPGDEEVLSALQLLQGCCLMDSKCKDQATKAGGIKALVERLVAASVVPVREACLDALLALLVGSHESLQEFKRLGALKQITDVVQNPHVTQQLRLKALEFLALLLADASEPSRQQMEDSQHQPLDMRDEVRQLLGAAVLSQLERAVDEGALVEGSLELLAQEILASLDGY